MQTFQPVADVQVRCKCCGSSAELCGVVDFHKNCEDRRHAVLRLSGIPVYYHRCQACGFLFTNTFDHFTRDEFVRWIYNADYALVDPDYREARPQTYAPFIAKLLSTDRSLRILDFGGGEGRTTQILKSMGFNNTVCYDPLASPGPKPTGPFDCILTLEVLEHSPEPRQTLSEMIAMLANPGLIVISTLVQPPEIQQLGVNWWYVSPRNGHVSLFSRQSLQLLAQSFGYRLASFDDSMHVLVREIPPFASGWMQSH